MGVRVALGAERHRLVRQLMTESVLLAGIGGALGVLTAYWALDALSVLLANLLPLGRSAHVDGRALAVTGGVALHLGDRLRADAGAPCGECGPQTALRPAGRGTTPGGRRWADALVGMQVALAMLLLVASLLLMGSFTRLSRVDVGFDVANVLTVPLDLPERQYPESQRRHSFRKRSQGCRPSGSGIGRGDSDQSIPAVGICQRCDAGRSRGGCAAERVHAGRLAQRDAGNSSRCCACRSRADAASPRGSRRCAWGRHHLAEPGAEVLAASSALGRRLYWGGVGGRTRTVVGVVGDIRDVKLDADPTPMLYLPYAQLPMKAMTLLVRTRGTVAGTAAAVRREIQALDPALPVPEVRPLEENRLAAISAPRFRMVLLGVFGAVAFCWPRLVSTASYRSRSHSATREIAIRMAIGARPAQVANIFFKRGVRLTLAGGVVGLLGAWELSGVLRSLLFQTDAHEPELFALAGIVLGVVALMASYLPARRAARLDPLAALSREQL